MPWKELSVYQQRLAVIHRIVTLKHSVAQVAREIGLSRKTVHKWLKRYRERQPFALMDQSRRPHRIAGKTPAVIEEAVVAVRHEHNWGPRKIRRLLQQRKLAVPSIRTVASILSRQDCAQLNTRLPQMPPQPFERAAPNQLWQMDHKGPLEVARQRVMPLTILDDHSRYCLCFVAVTDVSMPTAWRLLWQVFGEFGLPEAILCDHAFGHSRHEPGISWFDAQLVRLNIQPIHGRTYHPQTQGKVERLHGTIQRELIEFNARRDSIEHFMFDAQRWRRTYNTLRPHEALGDVPPIVRYQPSDRLRPARLPEVSYPPDSVTRKVSQIGDFRYRNARIHVGRGLYGQTVRLQPREHDVAVYYAWKLLRIIPNELLGGPHSEKVI